MADKNQIIAIAQQLLKQEIGPVDAAHRLYPLVIDRGILDRQEENMIAAIVSSTDHLAIGAVADLWDPAAYQKKKVELTRQDELWSERMVSFSRDVLRRMT